MERLTNKKEADAQRRGYENRLKNGYPRNIPEGRFLKLAAYEDTGLDPEEVKEHEAAYIEIMTRTYGPLHQKIRQWLKAEKDGRLVVLPCKTTDTVYITELVFENGKQKRRNNPSGERVVSAQIDHVTIGGTTGEPVFDLCTETGGWYYSMEPNQFHLTREEAEAALRKGEDEQNDAD